MTKYYHFSFLLFLVLFSVEASFAQTADSIRTYKLDEITVKSGLILEPRRVTEISLKKIEQTNAVILSDFAKYVPSLKLQNNSRGESLIYLRGSGERQLSLFFDGTPLNIPWDNRIDLSLLPAELVSEISITKGIPSIVYGANTLAGVVNVSTRELNESEFNRNFALQLGENNFRKFSGFWMGGNDKVSFAAAASIFNNDGYRLPASFQSDKNPSGYRVNSQSKILNTFYKIKLNLNKYSSLGASISYISSKKGVPPETDVSNPRFWQYPEWKKLTLNMNGTHDFDHKKNSVLAYSFSYTNFKSQINQYRDITYTSIDDIEKGKDNTFYGRLIYRKLLSAYSMLKFAVSGYTTSHEESFLSNSYKILTYSQNVYSGGAEYEYARSKFTLVFGASIDGAFTPKTGDKPSKKGTTDYSFNSALIYSFNPFFSAQISLGRKTRFPTLRESFSGALGRFVLNPDLKAESAVTGEISMNYHRNFVKTDLTFFTSFLEDGIVRKSLPGRQFIRINKESIRNFGVEFNSTFELWDGLSSNFYLTYLNSFAKDNAGAFNDTLEYKPEFIGGLNINYLLLENLSSTFEVNYVGKEFGLQEGSEFFRRLPDYFIFNFRFSYTFLFNKSNIEAFVRVNNIFDKLYFTQWSLPEAGRHYWGGISFNF